MRLALATVAALITLVLAPLQAQDTWESVWTDTGFDRIGIQSGGMEKSMVTHARDSLHIITPTRNIREDSQITLILQIAGRADALADRWLIPVEGDDLLPMFEEAGIEVNNRLLKLGDCLTFNPSNGQIAAEGPAMHIARRAATENPEGSNIEQAGIRLFSRINAVIEASSSVRLFPDPLDPEGRWYSLEEASAANLEGTEHLRHQFSELLSAVGQDDPEAARPLAQSIAQELTALPNYAPSARLSVDHAYTTMRPYFWSSLLYVVSGALFFISMVTKGNRWWLAAMLSMGLGWAIHTLGAIGRGYLLSRMPLSSIYEATTTGLAFVILIALVLEAIYRMRVVGMTSALLAFVYYRWLVSSEQFGSDAIEPLRAVLNSYWLDYHVTCMMLSYGAFTISFAMAGFYLMRSHFPRIMKWAPETEQLDLYNHRSIQFGWPLLGLGIVLGAVWADTAWGRMWSWDPKETWSLITWLIYTAYLHVRLVNGWEGRIMAWASIIGYAAVVFTYLGVNFILSGLHSYAG